MSATAECQVFNRSDRVVEGWYWALRSADLRRGRVLPLKLMGRDLAIFRGRDGQVVALDAYCPHMGAHLAEGKVEGDGLRCFFHHWKFARDGAVVDVPCQSKPPRTGVRSWPVAERYGLIWVYTAVEATSPVPFVPELEGVEVEATLGNAFTKRCHPNVVLINAIDSQHFHSVHDLPNVLDMVAEPIDERRILVRNANPVPASSRLWRFFSRFYSRELTYSMCYTNGSTGTVTLGPDFLHFHIMFTLRTGPDGVAEGQTVLLTKKRRGPIGWSFNRVVLLLTRVVGDYFAKGDTKVFATIKFDLKTPLKMDRAILEFIRHLEGQRVAPWAQLPTRAEEPHLAEAKAQAAG